MTENLSLFGDDSSRDRESEAQVAPIADWRVDLLRKALDARGLSTITERQQAIEAAAGRPADSLRAVTHDEAMRVLTSLGQACRGGHSA